MNTPAVRAQPIVSFMAGSGALRRLRSSTPCSRMAAELDGRTFFSEETIAWMTTTLSDGMDRRFFKSLTALSAGHERSLHESTGRESCSGSAECAFGHPGAGGRHAFASILKTGSRSHPMSWSDGHSMRTFAEQEKSLRLVDAVYRAFET